MKRREFLKTSLSAAAGGLLNALPVRSSPHFVRMALLHLAPIPGDLAADRRLVESGLAAASANGADCAITPELCVSGYAFSEKIGTDWIAVQPDPWTKRLCRMAERLHLTVLLAQPERDPASQALHNTVFVIGPHGRIIGRHRKIRTLRTGTEAWSSPDDYVTPIRVLPIGKVGVMICADAHAPWIARQLKRQGATLLLSSAAWGPGVYGPDGEWERCTRDTGLPLLVCNRTGRDGTLDFTHAPSVVVKDGRRLYTFTAPSSTVFLVEWDLDKQAPGARPPKKIGVTHLFPLTEKSSTTR
jgi:5-aminopentanamidase